MKAFHDTLAEGIVGGDRLCLARAITLCESSLLSDQSRSAKLLDELLPHTGLSWRIGVSGTPGVGKSTFINALGKRLLGMGRKIAVLAIDPSSPLSGGSILGDKTRMIDLMSSANVYIRPSPSKGILGGISRHTRESILLCEAAGFDTIIIETVGVGQSEVSVKEHCDCMVGLQLPNAGDDLQAIKRGILEVIDALVIHKADGPLKSLAISTANSFAHHLRTMTLHRPVPAKAFAVSSLDFFGIDQLIANITEFFNHSDSIAIIKKKRHEQDLHWFQAEVSHLLSHELLQLPFLQKMVVEQRQAIDEGKRVAKQAAWQIFTSIKDRIS
jgi:LAO/AO transport system kinase